MSTREQLAIEFYAILYYSENESQRADVHCEEYRLRKAVDMADNLIEQLKMQATICPDVKALP